MEPIDALRPVPHHRPVKLALPLAFALAAMTLATASGCSSKGAGQSGGTGGGGGAAVVPVDPTGLDPTQTGPFTCGHRELSMTYSPPGGLPSRTIPVHVWYPSQSTDGDHPKYEGIFEDDHSYDDVPLSMPKWPSGRMPVLVHSHGYEGFAGNSARLMCHFASQGWLAIAPEHVGNLLGDTPATLPLAMYVYRPFDVRSALDFVAGLPAGDPLAGKADFTSVAMSGHSFGTYTAWALSGAPQEMSWYQTSCMNGGLAACDPTQLAVLAGDVSDPRAKVIIPLAGAPSSQFSIADYDQARTPMLMMSGSLNDVGDGPVYMGVTKLDVTWVVVDGGCHQLFGLGNTVLGDPGCSVLPDEQGFALVNPWILSYARYHLLMDRTAVVKGLVEGTQSISPLVHVQHKLPM